MCPSTAQPCATVACAVCVLSCLALAYTYLVGVKREGLIFLQRRAERPLRKPRDTLVTGTAKPRSQNFSFIIPQSQEKARVPTNPGRRGKTVVGSDGKVCEELESHDTRARPP